MEEIIISNTTDHVLPHFQKPRHLKKDTQQGILDELQGVWKCRETLSFQFPSSETTRIETEADYVQMFIHFSRMQLIIISFKSWTNKHHQYGY